MIFSGKSTRIYLEQMTIVSKWGILIMVWVWLKKKNTYIQKLISHYTQTLYIASTSSIKLLMRLLIVQFSSSSCSFHSLRSKCSPQLKSWVQICTQHGKNLRKHPHMPSEGMSEKFSEQTSGLLHGYNLCVCNTQHPRNESCTKISNHFCLCVFRLNVGNTYIFLMFIFISDL